MYCKSVAIIMNTNQHHIYRDPLLSKEHIVMHTHLILVKTDFILHCLNIITKRLKVVESCLSQSPYCEVIHYLQLKHSTLPIDTSPGMAPGVKTHKILMS